MYSRTAKKASSAPQTTTKDASTTPQTTTEEACTTPQTTAEEACTTPQTTTEEACTTPPTTTKEASTTPQTKEACTTPQTTTKRACSTPQSASKRFCLSHSATKRASPTPKSANKAAGWTVHDVNVTSSPTPEPVTTRASLCLPGTSTSSMTFQTTSESIRQSETNSSCKNSQSASEQDPYSDESCLTEKVEAPNEPSCSRKLYPCPIKMGSSARKKELNKKRTATKKRKPDLCKNFNIDSFLPQIYPELGPFLTECVHMKLRGKKKYTLRQKWIAVNILVSGTISGYKIMRVMLPLPPPCTLKRLLQTLNMTPGVTKRNVQMLKLKLCPKSDADKLTFILVDEMSLKKRLSYNESKDLIIGYDDDGTTRSRKLATSSLCVMAVGVKKNWKFPIGYYVSANATESTVITKIITHAIKVLENEGFIVMGITTDQGSNFETVLKSLGSTPSNPKIVIDHQSYFAFKDPPHLLRSARNFLLNGNVIVPSFSAPASWKDIEAIFLLNRENNLKRLPRITSEHVHNLKFGAKMKVELAAQVLSNSCSAAIDTCIEDGMMEASAAATSTYLKRMNDIFDVLNSSPKVRVSLRKPLHSSSPSIEFLKEALQWLEQLQELNAPRKCRFINGFIQSINVILQMRPILDTYNLKYLSTRNLCQDELELFFGKVRQLQKVPDAQTFTQSYVEMAETALIRTHLVSSCGTSSDQQLEETLDFLPEAPEQKELNPPVIELEEEEKTAAVMFEGNTEIGGIFESVAVEDAAICISGYLAMKTDEYHTKVKHTSLSNCNECGSILTGRNLNFHHFVSFKEYVQSDDPCRGLTYCSKSFVENVIGFERVFLYLFSKISHLPGFCKTVREVINSNCPKPNTCCAQIAFFIIKFFVKCRTLQSIRAYNRSLRKTSSKETAEKVTHN